MLPKLENGKTHWDSLWAHSVPTLSLLLPMRACDLETSRGAFVSAIGCISISELLHVRILFSQLKGDPFFRQAWVLYGPTLLLPCLCSYLSAPMIWRQVGEHFFQLLGEFHFHNWGVFPFLFKLEHSIFFYGQVRAKVVFHVTWNRNKELLSELFFCWIERIPIVVGSRWVVISFGCALSNVWLMSFAIL